MGTIISILTIVVVIYTLLDIWQKSTMETSSKVIWTIISLLFPLIGCIIYWFTKKQN